MAAYSRRTFSHYKQQLADKLGIEPGQPGSIHFGPESRGFDEEFFLQLLSEHKELKLSRGLRTIVWKRIRDRNEGLDMTVMVLCLLDEFRSQIDRMTEPQLVQEDGEKGSAPPGPDRPTWGVQPSSGVLLEGMSIGPKVPVGSVPQPQAKPRSPWGVQNKPVVW